MAKDSPRTTAGELQKIVESWGQKTLKKWSNSTYITTCCLGGLQEKKKKKKNTSRKENAFTKKQTPAYSVIRHDWNFKWDWLLWSDETKK